MKKRLFLSVVAALLAAVVLAAVAGAATTRDTEKVIASQPGATWLIKLKGATRVREVSFRWFANFQRSHAATYTDAVTGDAYSGVALKDLIGFVDDANTRTFNVKKATTGAGYIVRVTAIDGFSYDFASADVAAKEIIIANRVTPSGGSETALTFGTAKYKIDGDKVSFTPAWPLKVVGADVTSGKMKIGGIVRIAMLPTPAD